jgi:hypothetical protein
VAILLLFVQRHRFIQGDDGGVEAPQLQQRPPKTELDLATLAARIGLAEADDGVGVAALGQVRLTQGESDVAVVAGFQRFGAEPLGFAGRSQRLPACGIPT